MKLSAKQFFDAFGNIYPDEFLEDGGKLYRVGNGEIVMAFPIWKGRGGWEYTLAEENTTNHKPDTNPMTNGRFNW